MRAAQRVALGVALGVGWVVRLHEFILSRSLSWYEAALVTNILHKPIAGLLGPLDNHEAAPFGYLLISRAAVTLFGDGERALRLVPLVCGLASLPLLYVVAKRYLTPWLATACVAMCAIEPAQTLWANTVKSYATDLLVALLVLWLADWLTSTAVAMCGIAAIGAAAPWFSLPACFVLAGIWLAAALDVIRARQFHRLARLTIVAAVWGISFAVCYQLSLRPAEADPYLRDLWADYFLSVRDLQHDRWLLALVFVDPLNIVRTSAWPAVPIVVGGCVALWKMPARRGAEIALTLACAAAASCAGFYPWVDRMLIFATPFLLVVLVGGADQIGRFVARSRPIVSTLVTAAIVAAMAAPSVKWIWAPIDRWDETRPLIAHIRDHWRPGDRLYIAEYEAVYLYYRDRFGLGAIPYVTGPYYDDEQGSYDCASTPRLLGAARVWVLTDRLDVRACLAALGTPVLAAKAEDASLYLYGR